MPCAHPALRLRARRSLTNQVAGVQLPVGDRGATGRYNHQQMPAMERRIRREIDWLDIMLNHTEEASVHRTDRLVAKEKASEERRNHIRARIEKAEAEAMEIIIRMREQAHAREVEIPGHIQRLLNSTDVGMRGEAALAHAFRVHKTCEKWRSGLQRQSSRAGGLREANAVLRNWRRNLETKRQLLLREWRAAERNASGAGFAALFAAPVPAVQVQDLSGQHPIIATSDQARPPTRPPRHQPAPPVATRDCPRRRPRPGS
jgi:hypothetical protein